MNIKSKGTSAQCFSEKKSFYLFLFLRIGKFKMVSYYLVFYSKLRHENQANGESLKI